MQLNAFCSQCIDNFLNTNAIKKSERDYNMANIFIRTAVLYLFAFIMIRAMGRRQVGQLQPFEFVLAILIADLAAAPMSDSGIPLLYGIIPILTLFLLHTLISFISLKSERSRGIICGRPVIVIEKGKICKDRLKDLQYNLNDLLEQLRSKDVANIIDVEYAILETNGQLSIIKKDAKKETTNEDLNVHRAYEGLPMALILDGNINKMNLEKVGFNRKWLNYELSKHQISSAKDVLIFTIDMDGKTFIQAQAKDAKPIYGTTQKPSLKEELP